MLKLNFKRIIKSLAIILAAFLLVCFFIFFTAKIFGEKLKISDRFKEIDKTTDPNKHVDYYIIADKGTGNEYLLVQDASTGKFAITPLLNSAVSSN